MLLLAHPRFPLLELAYDDTHRAHMITNQNMVLPCLRARVHAPMHWDSRYAPYHFNVCPVDADDDIIERHARVWLWHFVSSFLFPRRMGVL
nr:unnamed protein product [Digitaria exilis]